MRGLAQVGVVLAGTPRAVGVVVVAVGHLRLAVRLEFKGVGDVMHHVVARERPE